MENDELKALIEKSSHPEFAKEHGMVYQVWDDGEITLQKSGDLLWQRNLHMIRAGEPSKQVPIELFPETYNGHGFIYTSGEEAHEVRKAITGLNY